ncbi:hypothetical protein FQA39_LY06752 [Lamprigera yunnana]|nr:hypothetical protein FQA39_LY06752 [Lamprigera yunnana]
MKFYKHDGTYEIQQDNDFGWWLEDIANLKKPEFKKYSVEPVIKIFPIKSVQETLENPEGFNKSESNKFYDLNPLKEKLTVLTSGDIWKSKLLLSIINFSLFKKLTEKESSYVEENVLICTQNINQTNVLKTPEKLKCTQFESLHFSRNEKFREKFVECLMLIRKNLQVLDTTIKEMQQEVSKIKNLFEEENERTRKLLIEYRNFSQELMEFNYLNEIVLLLMGKVEKIKSNNWPFKICSNQKKELNLII